MIKPEDTIITIGYDKNHEMDFGIRGDVLEMSIDQMNELRVMLMVAIGTTEGMFRRANEARHPAAGMPA